MKALLMVLLLSSCAFASDFTRGNQVDAIIRDSKPLYEDSDVCARVAEIGQKVVAASGNQSGFTFHFYVLNSPDVTTFSAPGGPVYVTTGLLRHLQSEDELAVMLGHEIAHINERHLMKMESSERSKIFWGRVLIVGAQAAGVFAGAAVQVETAKSLTTVVGVTRNGQLIANDQAGAQLAALTQGAVAWGTANGGSALLDLYYTGYKDEYEFTADRLAIEYANKAGYNGAALATVLTRLSEATGETSAAEISHLHSPNKVLAERTTKARGQGATPPQNP
jgi:predicted Zn-dependent protease